MSHPQSVRPIDPGHAVEPVAEADAGASAGLPWVDMGAVRLHAISEATCIELILRQLDRGRGGWVLTLNLHSLRLATRDSKYAELCAGVTLIVADGMPILWASRWRGIPLPERVTGADLLSTLTIAAAARGRSILLLGGTPGTAAAAAAVLRQRSPDVRIAGTLCPPMGFERRPDELAALTACTVEARPDIVFVALGTPKQDWLIGQLRTQLPGTWFIGVGNGFSFLCGAVRRAPRWMQRSGLEWLHRLLHEPRRLVKRYLVEDLPFAIRLLGDALRRRLRGTKAGGARSA